MSKSFFRIEIFIDDGTSIKQDINGDINAEIRYTLQFGTSDGRKPVEKIYPAHRITHMLVTYVEQNGKQ